MAEIHSFAYRMPRISLDHDMQFVVDGIPIHGRTRDVSDTGLLTRLDAVVVPGARGSIRWKFGGCTVEIDAQVEHANFLEVGLSFQFTSEPERQFVRTLVKVLSKQLRHN